MSRRYIFEYNDQKLKNVLPELQDVKIAEGCGKELKDVGKSGMMWGKS